MTFRWLALASLAACGKVASPPAEDAAVPVDAAKATPYRGTLSATQPVTFGGSPFCLYTITLQQLSIDLDVVASGQPTSGRVQALNVEGTDAACPNGVIPPTIANYTLSSSTTGAGGRMLTFEGAASNNPPASLVALLTPTGTQYTAMLTFHRTNQTPPLDWTVQTTIVLSPQ